MKNLDPFKTADEDISSFARLDFGRKARTGFGETVFGGGKTPEQLARIFAAFKAARQPALASFRPMPLRAKGELFSQKPEKAALPPLA